MQSTHVHVHVCLWMVTCLKLLKLRPWKCFIHHVWGCDFWGKCCSKWKLQDSMAWACLWAADFSKKSKAVFMLASLRETQVLGHRAWVTYEWPEVALLSTHIHVLYMQYFPLDSSSSPLYLLVYTMSHMTQTDLPFIATQCLFHHCHSVSVFIFLFHFPGCVELDVHGATPSSSTYM